MQDWCSGYSIPFSKRVLGRQRLRLPERFNAGILYVGPRTYDLDFIEWFLGEDAFRCTATGFECFVIEGAALGITTNGHKLETRETRWMAPDMVRRPIAFDITRKAFIPHKEEHRPPVERLDQSHRHELYSYKQP